MDIKSKNGALYSVWPPTKYLTFAVWIYLVPQYRPKNVLILGYGGGTVAGLIRLLYGDVPIIGVDIEPHVPPKDITFIQADAEEYVKTAGKFDCVIVDVFQDNRVPDFVYSKKFADAVSKISNYLIINIIGKPNMDNYKMELVCILQSNGNDIHYYKQRGILNDITPAV